MNAKIEINYSELGKVSALVGFVAALILFLTWDLHSFVLAFGCSILILLSCIGMMAWGMWKIDKIQREEDERNRSMRHNR